MSPMEWGIDRPGADFAGFTTPRDDPTLCRDQCAAEARCIAWTYTPREARCVLKNPAPPAVVNNRTVSGVKAIQ